MRSAFSTICSGVIFVFGPANEDDVGAMKKQNPKEVRHWLKKDLVDAAEFVMNLMRLMHAENKYYFDDPR